MRDLHLRPTGVPRIELLRYPDARPTFIVGSVRSGTSAMMAALREGAGIRGFNEGVLAQLLPGLLSLVSHHYGSHQQKPLMTMLGSVPEEFFATGIKNVFGKAFIETMGDGRWFDKTPGGAAIVAACPSLLEIFPNATFVFCKRRGIENLLSRQHKFPGKAFEAHCQAWVSTMESWRTTAPHLAGHTVEVDQAEMGAEPAAVAEKVGALLELSTEQREGMSNVLRSKRPEQTRAAQDDMPIALADTGWSAAEQETFRRICGPMMEAFGYSMTGVERAETTLDVYRFFVPVADGVVRRENIGVRKACRALDATSFQIKPNGHGAPAAAVRHGMIPMDRLRRFSAKVRSRGAGARESGGLVFGFYLERSSDRSEVFAAEQVVTVGPPADWTCDLPQLSGLYDAVLRVRPISSNANTERMAGIWIDAELTTA